jgi:hypothetical protein
VISISLISVPPWNARVRFGQAALYLNEKGMDVEIWQGRKSKAADSSVRALPPRPSRGRLSPHESVPL